MSSAKWQTVNGVRYSTGLCQSYTDGLKKCAGPEYTQGIPNNDKVSRAIALVRATAEEAAGRPLSSGTKTTIPGAQDPVVNEGEKRRLERARKSTEEWLDLRGKGPDPQGVPFLAADDWVGAVDGYIHRNGEKGRGYYRTSPPPTEEKETFVHEGKVWETVKELTIEEAIAFKERVAEIFPEGNGREHLPGNASGNTMDDWPSSDDEDWTATDDEEDWSTATGDELDVAVFGEGVLALPLLYAPDRVTVFMDEKKTKMPFGMVETAPFLELLWRNTGADCAGEEEEMEFPGGSRYTILLCDSRSNL